MHYDNQNSILPFSFPVSVVGIPMMATVVEDLSDHSCYKYKVRFENGIEDTFTLIEGPETYLEASDRCNDHYAKALQNDIYELTKIIPENFLFVIQVKLFGEQTNVWLVEEEPDPGEDKCIMVSYNSDFGFQLYCVNEQWGFREYKPTPLTEQEKQLAESLIGTLQKMYSPLQLDNVITAGQ